MMRERHCPTGRAARRREVRHFGMNESSMDIVHPYGQMPNRLAGRLAQQQLNPLLNYLGMGAQAGTPRYARQEARLAGATGPLADWIRQFRAYAPGIPGQAQEIGNRIGQEGNAAYGQFQNVLGTSLADTGRSGELARNYMERAASPIADEDLYQVAQRRVLQQLRPGLAARGLEGNAGAAAQAETDALRNLTTDFAAQRRADQYTSLQPVQQNAALRTQLAGTGFDAVGQLAQTLMQQFGIPMQAFGQVLQMLMGGTQPTLALTQATAPQVGQTSSGWRIL